MENIYRTVMEGSNPDIINLIKDMPKNSDMEFYVDKAENLIFHKAGKGKKIMVSAIIPKIQIYISKVKDNKAEFELSGNIEKSALRDKEVFYKGETIGIVREDKEKDKETRHFIEKIDDASLKIGDICTVESKIRCKDNILYGIGISSIIPLKIALNAVSENKDDVNDIYFTLSFSENSAKAAVNMIEPDYIYSIYCAEATDNFQKTNGCGIVYKDGNAVTPDTFRDLSENIAHTNQIKTQIYIGKQSPLLEIFGITGKGAEVLGICIPIEKLNSACEIACIDDIDAAVRLLAQILMQ